MGIFMITISQISSHTMSRVYPLQSACNLGLELPLDHLLSVLVVLRHVEGRTRSAQFDPARGRDPDGQACQDLVDLGVCALIDADPAHARGRLDPRVGQRSSFAVTAQDVETWVEQLPAQEATRRAPAPRELALARRIRAAVTRIHSLATEVREGQAFAEDADALHHDGVVSDSHSRRTAAREAAAEGAAVEHASDRDHASRDGLELLRRFSVEQAVRASGT